MAEKKKIGNTVKILLMVIVVSVSYVVFQDIGMSIIAIKIGKHANQIIMDHYFLVDTLLCSAMLGIYIPWYFRLKRQNKAMNIGSACLESRKPFPNSGRLKNAGGILIISLGLGGLSALWLIFASSFLTEVPVFGPSLESFDETWSDVDEHFYLWVLLSVAIIGPIIEEFIFRGIAYKYLERISTGYMPAIISGIAFGIWHMEPVQSVYAAIMGIIMGLVFKATRDLRYTIAIHITNNFLSTLPPGIDTETVNNGINILSIIMVIPILIIVVKFIRTMNREKRLSL